MITLVIGSDAVGSDGYRGEVLAAVVDPAARTVTHLVVEPEGRQGLARLVPLDLVEAGPDLVRLGCTEAEFKNLPAAEETLAEFVPGSPGPVQLLPPGWRDADEPTADGGTILRIPEQETVDVVPADEVEEHRGEHVHATDGDIGHLRALRIDPDSRQVTHVLIREGPVWGRKDIAIPVAQVTGFDDGIRLSITRQQVRDLPPTGALGFAWCVRAPTTSHARMPRIQQDQKPWRTSVRAGAHEQLDLVSTPLLWHERGIHALLTQRAGDGGITLSRVNTGPAPWRPGEDH